MKPSESGLCDSYLGRFSVPPIEATSMPRRKSKGGEFRTNWASDPINGASVA